jgi:conjugative transfer signal peptidase TraF
MQAIDKVFRAIAFISFFITIVFTISGFYNKYVIRNISISEPLGYYLKLPIGKIKKGNRYLICIDDQKYIDIMHKLGLPKVSGECPFNSPYVLKQVAGVPGDRVDISESGVSINNVWLTNTRGVAEHKGILLLPIPSGYSHVLTRNEYFMLGITMTSYDSRYFGIVHSEQFRNRVIYFMSNR